MKAVNQNAFDDVSFEKMRVFDGVRGDEIEIIRVEVRFDRHFLLYSRRVCDPAGVLHNTAVRDRLGAEVGVGYNFSLLTSLQEGLHLDRHTNLKNVSMSYSRMAASSLGCFAKISEA